MRAALAGLVTIVASDSAGGPLAVGRRCAAHGADATATRLPGHACLQRAGELERGVEAIVGIFGERACEHGAQRGQIGAGNRRQRVGGLGAERR